MKSGIKILIMLFFLLITGMKFLPSDLIGQKKPLSIHSSFPYFFSDPDGKPLILMGDYTWEGFSGTDSDYNKLFRSMKERGLNLSRVWLWWGSEEFPGIKNKKHIEPFLRNGAGYANDGKPQYDLSKFNPEFFVRLKDFCRAADENGIYLQLMMMDAWMIKHPHLWKLNAFNKNNNINGVDGDPGNTGKGTDGKRGFCSTGNKKVVSFQKAYIKEVVHTVNSFDNIFFEIANENYYSEEWELMLCDYIKELEKSLPKQHMTIRRDFPSHSYVIQKWDPVIVHKGILEKRYLGVPLLFDTDWMINKNDDEVRKAAWSAVATGAHFSYMDDAMDFFIDTVIPDPRSALHKQIDHLAKFIRKFSPWEMAPADSIVKEGLVFVLAGQKELFAYLPHGGDIKLDLAGMKGNLVYEWFNPITGLSGKRFLAEADTLNNFTAPDKNDWSLIIRTAGSQTDVSLLAPGPTPQFGIAEFVIDVKDPFFENPFTDADVTATFITGETAANVNGFADSQDGTTYRLRFSPELSGKIYDYKITFQAGNFIKNFTGKIQSTSPVDKGPVIADPKNPRHFIYKGSNDAFFHLGNTLYNLLDISNDDSTVESAIKYCRDNGFNKIRFLLSGYPRDFDNRTSDDVDHGVPEDPWKSPNYGSLPGRVNPLPTWTGEPHNYDFTRFNVDFWQRVDRAVKLMKENGIIATCIFIIEKQNLPGEIGILTENEYRLYKYGVARLAAYSNVWWDLGNEHNEFRKPEWGNTMGNFVKDNDPYNRLTSAHAYAEFFYNDSPWADFIITQQYGDPDSVHNWTMKYFEIPKPYINEEYGYEGLTEKPVGHGMNSDWVRRCHWAIAMAGGYATYGDWSKGTSYFYMGIPGPGKAALQMKHIRTFFEALPFSRMIPADLTSNGYCLTLESEQFVFYLPEGGKAEINLSGLKKRRTNADWYDPRTGAWGKSILLRRGRNFITAPDKNDWVLLVK